MAISNEQANILKILADAAKEYVSPMLNNVYLKNAAIQCKVFTSKEEWVIIFEEIGYSEKLHFINSITAFGNKITNNVWACAKPVFDEYDQTRFIKECGISETATQLTPIQLLRVIASYYKEQLFLSDTRLLEVAGRNSNKLELFLKLNKWQHPDIADDELPGEIPCFVSLARAIAAKDKLLFKCNDDECNTHWTNWE